MWACYLLSCCRPHTCFHAASIIHSAVHVLLGDQCTDVALEQTPQGVAALHPASQRAMRHYEAAIKSWPANATAIVALAGLHREGGRMDSAIELYQRCAQLELLPEPSGCSCGGDDGDNSDGDDGGWEWEWVGEPRRKAVSLAAYMQALLCEIVGQRATARALMARFGFKWVRTHQQPICRSPDPHSACVAVLVCSCVYVSVVVGVGTRVSAVHLCSCVGRSTGSITEIEVPDSFGSS